MQELTIKRLNKPSPHNLDHDIEWLCHSLGLCAGRDLDQISAQIVAEILSRPHAALSSQLLAHELKTTVGRINHHLRNLIASGILYREKRRIKLRGGSLKAAVQEIRKDTERVLDDIETMAEEIDVKLGIKNR